MMHGPAWPEPNVGVMEYRSDGVLGFRASLIEKLPKLIIRIATFEFESLLMNFVIQEDCLALVHSVYG